MIDKNKVSELENDLKSDVHMLAYLESKRFISKPKRNRSSGEGPGDNEAGSRWYNIQRVM